MCYDMYRQIVDMRKCLCRISGSAKPLRFELWGAHEDLLLPNLALSLAAIPKLDRRTHNTRDTRFIQVRATVVV